MKKSGLADSPFFSPPRAPKVAADPPLEMGVTAKEQHKPDDDSGRHDAKQIERNFAGHGTTTPRHHDTMVLGHHETIIKSIRKAVKEFGKEAATHRFTTEEKSAISNIIFTYKNEGIKTSENEITRIAINFVINDYRENGTISILDRVLKALNE